MEKSKTEVLLSCAYLAPVQYFTKFILFDEVWIELREHFLKQSYRNRCTILTANGPQSLSIPVTEGSNSKKEIREVMISYDHPWQKVHWKAMISAYNNAPYFEYYADSIAPYYHQKKWRYLVDYNLELQKCVLDEIGLTRAFKYTENFIPVEALITGMNDFRFSIHPKTTRQIPDPAFIPSEYMQVFQEKFGFTPNLSILDLLFNEGPQALHVLRQSSSNSTPPIVS
jgi:hypothetical protein